MTQIRNQAQAMGMRSSAYVRYLINRTQAKLDKEIKMSQTYDKDSVDLAVEIEETAAYTDCQFADTDECDGCSQDCPHAK